ERQMQRVTRPRAFGRRLGELLAEKPPAGNPEVKLADGARAKFVRASADGFVVAATGGERTVAPLDLDLHALLELSSRLTLAPAEWLDRAFVALACKSEKAFFTLIDHAAADASLKDGVDAALAFQRDLPDVPERGFLRVGERWLTFAEK